MKSHSRLSLFFLLLLLCGTGTNLKAQDLHLVWAENASLVDGKFRIIALKESYQGFEYTSAHIRTEEARSWKYSVRNDVTQ